MHAQRSLMTSLVRLACLLALAASAACSTTRVARTPPGPPPVGAAFLAASDGTRLYTSVMGPGTRGVVWYVLGPEAGSRPVYPGLTSALHAAGYATAQVHPRGAGHSDGPRGDATDTARVLDDLHRFARTLTERHRGVPLYLMGHSAGAALALELAARTQVPLAGVVLVNPAYRLVYSEGMGPGLTDYVAFAFNYVFRPAAPTVDMNARPEAIRDPDDRAEALAMRSDPFVVRFFTMRAMSAEGALMKRCAENARGVHAPVLLISGQKDALVDPAGSAELFAAAASRDKQRLTSPAGHGSRAVETVVEPLVKWFEAHRGTSAPP